MPAAASRHEHGSFAPVWTGPAASGGPPPWAGGTACNTGRQALASVVAQGVVDRGWRRLWVPGYFCHDALRPLFASGIELLAYEDLPGAPARLPPARAGKDAVLVDNLLGVRTATEVPAEVDVVEDHTHDPLSTWAATSTATYCIASLRKTLPVPDGAVMWSPSGAPLPAAPPAPDDHQGDAILAAMYLKRLHLDGHPVDKPAYRARHRSADQALQSAAVAAPSATSVDLLGALPLALLRERRARNFRALADGLEDAVAVVGADADDVAPVGCTLVVDPTARDELVAQLIDVEVYPSVLWALDDPVVAVTEHEVRQSRSLLTLDCGPHHDLDHLATVVERVRACLR